jgi:OPT oligopeptide transporter protein
MHYWLWFFVGIFFSHYVYKYHKKWWAKNVYILSIGLDSGVAAMALVASITVNMASIYGVSWWGLELDDHCPLAKCPIATGVEVGGCPKY